MAKDNETPDLIQVIWNMIGGEKIARAIVSGRATLEVKLVQILSWLGTITVSTTAENFVAKEKFRLKKDGGICAYFDNNFTDRFLSGDGKIEDLIGEHELRYGKLLKVSVDGPIIEELGGEAKAETTLSEIFALMTIQSTGKEGSLLTNGYANIFYVRDRTGVLRAVGVDCYDDGWRVFADSVESPYEWSADDQVFSRNS